LNTPVLYAGRHNANRYPERDNRIGAKLNEQLRRQQGHNSAEHAALSSNKALQRAMAKIPGTQPSLPLLIMMALVLATPQIRAADQNGLVPTSQSSEHSLGAACSEHALRANSLFYPCVRTFLAETKTDLQDLCAQRSAQKLPALEKLLRLENRDALFHYGKELFEDCMANTKMPE
jgi:hypothetical protein